MAAAEAERASAQNDAEREDNWCTTQPLTTGYSTISAFGRRSSIRKRGYRSFEERFRSDINIDYIEVPLLVKLTAPRSVGAIRLHLLGGPALSFQSACWIYDSEDDDDYDCDELDVKVEAKDVGAVVGAGLDAELGRVLASVGGRYTIGTRTVDADPDPIDINNRVWSLTVSIAVRLVDL